jgi:uncharacterized membrane protein HdeD (DUF308 family)
VQSSLKRASAALVLGAGRKPPELLIVAFALGVLDYLSYGVTLSLLRAGRRDGGWPPLILGILDAIAAVLILYGLALTLALILAAINALGAVPLLPLAADPDPR